MRGNRSAKALATRPTMILAFVSLMAQVALVNPAISAEAFWMEGAALRSAFSASAIEGQYVDGRTFHERYRADGSLDYRESTQKSNWTGRWSIVSDRFCTIYDNFGTGGCFRVRQVSLNCFEFYFDTRTEDEARRSTLRRPTWTARAWREDQPPTCIERPMV